MAETLATKIRLTIRAVDLAITCHPNTASDWRSISRQLRTAGEQAKKIALLAERMEQGTVVTRCVPHGRVSCGACFIDTVGATVYRSRKAKETKASLDAPPANAPERDVREWLSTLPVNLPMEIKE